MSRPAQYVVQHEDGRFATRSGWVALGKHASKFPSRYAAKQWALKIHSNAPWTVEQLHPKDLNDGNIC